VSRAQAGSQRSASEHFVLSYKRLEKGQFSAAWKRAKSKRGLEMTLSELALFIEGSEVASRMPLSPSLLTKSDLRPKFPDDTGASS
jgi:transposase